MRNKKIVLSNLQCDINELQICILHAVELQIRQNESSSLRQKKEAIILFVRNTHPCPIYFYQIPPKSFDDVCFIPIFVMSNKMKESKKQLLLTL